MRSYDPDKNIKKYIFDDILDLYYYEVPPMFSIQTHVDDIVEEHYQISIFSHITAYVHKDKITSKQLRDSFKALTVQNIH